MTAVIYRVHAGESSNCWTEAVAQLVELCPRVHETLNLISSSAIQSRCGGVCLESRHLGGVSMVVRKHKIIPVISRTGGCFVVYETISQKMPQRPLSLLSKFVILCWTAFIAILGCIWMHVSHSLQVRNYLLGQEWRRTQNKKVSWSNSKNALMGINVELCQ